MGPGVSAAWVYREAERRRRVDAQEADEVRRRRYLDLVWEQDRSALYLAGMVPPEQGAALEEALRRGAERADPEPDVVDRWGARLADAVVRLATRGRWGGTPRPVLVVHADVATLLGDGDGLAETESGVRLAAEAVGRIAGRAKIEWVLERDGRAVGIGRHRGKVPDWLGRQVRYRDAGCRFPGCEATWWSELHHVVRVRDDGPTDLDNLLMLCGAHHLGLIHRRGWTIRGRPHERLTFVRPDGAEVSEGHFP